jgi:hypothetical protein
MKQMQVTRFKIQEKIAGYVRPLPFRFNLESCLLNLVSAEGGE